MEADNKGPEQKIVQDEQKTAKKLSKYSLISIVTGIVSILISPTIIAFIAVMLNVVCLLVIASSILALIAFIFGLLALIKLKDRYGLVGIVLAIVDGIITIVVPILYVWITPMSSF